ncbi:hypothetical protein JD969_06540 [Planctomycetota bacterium]|nr:hypothetical protein JD969_06540 [Planctomycetota bacterium]
MNKISPSFSRYVSHRYHGAIFILTLLSLLLIAAVVFYVLNVGKHIQGRVVTQNAADAAVMAGASEVARTFNTIAMNNTQIVRNLAAINLIHSIPQAVDYTITSDLEKKDGDLTAVFNALWYQHHSEGPFIPWYRTMLKRTLYGYRGSLTNVYPQIQELERLYIGKRGKINQLTKYRDHGRGDLWKSIYTMHRQNTALVKSLNERMQLATWECAKTNIRESRESGGILLPVKIRTPIMIGHFDDFERPLKRGMLPGPDYTEFIRNDDLRTGFGHVDHPIENRGPWDTLFGWRELEGEEFDDNEIITASPGKPPRRRKYITSEHIKTAYRTYGPQEWMINKLFGSNDINSPGAYTLFDERIKDFSSYKLDYLFPGDRAPQIRRMYKPNWEIDLVVDNTRMHDINTYSIEQYHQEMKITPPPWAEGASLYLICEIKSRTAFNYGIPGTRGKTWNYIKRYELPYPYLASTRDRKTGYALIQPETPISYKKINPHVEEYISSYKTDPNNFEHGGDSEINLPPRIVGRFPDGSFQYKSQKVYWLVYRVFLATDFHDLRQGTLPIPNPHEGFDRNLSSSPAPYDFIQGSMPAGNEQTEDRMKFLSVVYQDDRAEIWPDRFDRNRHYPNQVSVAQAKIYNNHSWDLWTQMWHAQLEPVQSYDTWADEYNEGDVLDIVHEDPEVIFELGKYLESVKKMSDYGKH